jgi:hypothetical protein
MKPPQPLFKVAVKVKKAPSAADAAAGGPGQQPAAAGVGGGGLLGLIGDYGSSSGSEDNT